MAEKEVKTHPVPTAAEKKAAQDALIAQMKACDAVTAAMVDIRQALGTKFAEVGNSDKMSYTDRDTGTVQKWGVSAVVIKREDDRMKTALAAAKDALKAL